MAYIPDHEADVFVSYCHDDDFAWVEQFQSELKKLLVRKLRARLEPKFFFDELTLRAGRPLNDDIPNALAKTGFFVAIVSPRFLNSNYCRHKELTTFIRHVGTRTGRIIQVQIDLSATLPLQDLIAVKFAGPRGIFRIGTPEYEDALLRVAEPIVSELDRMYAASKMVFLAWSNDRLLEGEREALQKEIEGRGLRIYPDAVAEFDDDRLLRKALDESSTSVHFLGERDDAFENRQLEAALQLGKRCVIASLRKAETRVGPPSSPAPIYVRQGNPLVRIADAIDEIIGRDKRGGAAAQHQLGKARLFLVFKPDADSVLGIKVRQRIINKGPFDVVEPPRSAGNGSRYAQIEGARAALLCWRKADTDWLKGEFEALSAEMGQRQLYDLLRVLYDNDNRDLSALELGDSDRIIKSDVELDGFLQELLA